VTNTPRRALRASDEVWLPAMAKAKRLGLPDGLSGQIRDWLVAWVQEDYQEEERT
jgi:hypothetical protein